MKVGKIVDNKLLRPYDSLKICQDHIYSAAISSSKTSSTPSHSALAVTKHARSFPTKPLSRSSTFITRQPDKAPVQTASNPLFHTPNRRSHTWSMRQPLFPPNSLYVSYRLYDSALLVHHMQISNKKYTSRVQAQLHHYHYHYHSIHMIWYETLVLTEPLYTLYIYMYEGFSKICCS